MGDNTVMKHCKNCKRDIAECNYVMHELHCVRNIVLCGECNEPVPKSDMKSHFDDFHALVACTQCQQSVEKSQIDHHKNVACCRRPAACEYCKLVCPWAELEGHVTYCGSRTEQCLLCMQYIQYKDLTMHEDTDCQYPLPPSSHFPESTASSDQRPPPRSDFAFEECLRLVNGVGTEPASRVGGSREPPSRINGSREPGSRVGISRAPPSRVGGSREPPSRVGGSREPPSRVREPGRGPSRVVRTVKMRSGEGDGLIASLARDFNSSASDGGHLRAIQALNSQEMFPCEFCSESFPIDILLHHQVVCAPSRAPSVLDCDVSPSTSSTDQPSPDRLSTETMLPCEICDHLYPESRLVIHQAVCEASGDTMLPAYNRVLLQHMEPARANWHVAPPQGEPSLRRQQHSLDGATWQRSPEGATSPRRRNVLPRLAMARPHAASLHSPTGSTPSRSTQTGSTPSRSTPTGSTATGSMPNRVTPSGSMLSRSTPTGSMATGSTASGTTLAGRTYSGESSQGRRRTPNMEAGYLRDREPESVHKKSHQGAPRDLTNEHSTMEARKVRTHLNSLPERRSGDIALTTHARPGYHAAVLVRNQADRQGNKTKLDKKNTTTMKETRNDPPA